METWEGTEFPSAFLPGHAEIMHKGQDLKTGVCVCGGAAVGGCWWLQDYERPEGGKAYTCVAEGV